MHANTGPNTDVEWLPLNEYSNKYIISLSTLRRRIKSDEVEFKFEEGKYWLRNVSVPKHVKVKHLSGQTVSSTQESMRVQEIKDVFKKVLQEKEEQILSLHEEAGDLKTLVKILEEQVENLKLNQTESFLSLTTDHWQNKEI